ncbi:MAG: CrcB family protein [Gemmataceae bacterium]
MSEFTKLMLIAFAGAGGTLARHGVNVLFRTLKWSDTFPWHTFIINLTGSFLLGTLAVALKDRPHLLIILGVGFCGGFTTFSSFSLEIAKMIGEQRFAAAGLYALGSLALGILGAVLGMRMLEK